LLHVPKEVLPHLHWIGVLVRHAFLPADNDGRFALLFRTIAFHTAAVRRSIFDYGLPELPASACR
ncbi:hypothetical protein, partial [Stenotrophomonas maltophilia]|uniref:hypothetical protein n=1 Tax=Stenotrophomonas maltophilia TaxID=40324 RepID=UPI001953F099